jgi:siderophore synthetase component
MTADALVVRRVLNALLREDVVGLRTRSVPVEHPDGMWLRSPGTPGVLLPVAADGFQCEYAARLPLLLRAGGGEPLTTTDAILGALRALAQPQDREGFDAFADECRQTLATVRLHDESAGTVREDLTTRYGPDPADWTGLGASLAFDTLAAYQDHPVYPTSRARLGLTEPQLRAYAPEFHPRFTLRWAAVPRHALTVSQDLPPWWPALADLGLRRLSGSHAALPVHPLSADRLPGTAVLADRPYLDVVPTLSMRTVALADDPAVHLKLPLATATLGLRNQRTVKPGTLADGAAGQRLLEAVLAKEPRFRDRILLADETAYAHAGHQMLAALIRRYPVTRLDGALIVPLAALLAPAPDGQEPLLDRLAARYHRGDRHRLFDAYLTLLLDWQTTLFGYGIALESHQQNISLVLSEDAPPRLLLKDNDGPRVNTARCPFPVDDFADPRTLTTDDGPLADLFTTITVHLCAGAYAFALGGQDRDRLLRLVRDRLETMAGPGLRERLLAAERLPVKAMVTAGTLLSKERSGAADINKHYTSGPNYLRRPPQDLR